MVRGFISNSVLFGFVSLAVAALLPAGAPWGTGDGSARAQDAQAVLNERCAQCHTREPGDKLTRISHARKTPEAWFMTIVRMEMIHGLQITGDERRALVKYLADAQGLAPSEAQGFRYILERQPNVVEGFADADFVQMCARCHSGARVALQRRDAEEWTLLMHFHLGQFPTTEYQALGRDREWFKLALEDVVPKLAASYPLKTAAWDSWQQTEIADLAGSWRVAGATPGRGAFFGTMTATSSGDDSYAISLDAAYADGGAVAGSGSATVYTGYEWRGSLTVDGVSMRQVFAATPDGLQLSGRMFQTDADELGSRVVAVREVPGNPVVLAVEPAYLRAGSTARLTIVGTGLGGNVSLGDGVTAKVIETSPDRIVVEATAAADAAVGSRTVTVGGQDAVDLFTVYHSIDAVKVEPGYGIARVGGNGATAAVQAAFEAVAYAAGPDGQAGTEDDVRIGVMPAEWSVAPFDDVAATLDDVKYAGAMDAASGLFTPGEAGLNPARPYSTNNAGNLKVIGTVTEGGQAVSGEGQLIVTVQRWNDPPIR